MDACQAHIGHLEALAQLFDQYRVFYNASFDLAGARDFIQERLQKGDSTIFGASQGGHIAGFTQLYPSFSSVAMKPIWILNDLYVEPAYRGLGLAKLLLTTAKNFALHSGAARITLATQSSNHSAQWLYESFGYSRDEEFRHYLLSL